MGVARPLGKWPVKCNKIGVSGRESSLQGRNWPNLEMKRLDLSLIRGGDAEKGWGLGQKEVSNRKFEKKKVHTF